MNAARRSHVPQSEQLHIVHVLFIPVEIVAVVPNERAVGLTSRNCVVVHIKVQLLKCFVLVVQDVPVFSGYPPGESLVNSI